MYRLLTDEEIMEKLDNEWDGLDSVSLVEYVLEFAVQEERKRIGEWLGNMFYQRFDIADMVNGMKIAIENLKQGLDVGGPTT